MLPMQGLIYGPSSSVLLYLSIATCMELSCAILGLSKKICAASMGMNVIAAVTFALDIM